MMVDVVADETLHVGRKKRAVMPPASETVTDDCVVMLKDPKKLMVAWPWSLLPIVADVTADGVGGAVVDDVFGIDVTAVLLPPVLVVVVVRSGFVCVGVVVKVGGMPRVVDDAVVVDVAAVVVVEVDVVAVVVVAVVVEGVVVVEMEIATVATDVTESIVGPTVTLLEATDTATVTKNPP